MIQRRATGARPFQTRQKREEHYERRYQEAPLIQNERSRFLTPARAPAELEEERLGAFEALAQKAKQMRERILGARAVQLDKRTVA